MIIGFFVIWHVNVNRLALFLGVRLNQRPR